jgi:hypothetical protein
MPDPEPHRIRPLVRDTVIVVASMRANYSASEHDILLTGVSRVLRTTNGAARLNALEVERDALKDEVQSLRSRLEALEAAAPTLVVPE